MASKKHQDEMIAVMKNQHNEMIHNLLAVIDILKKIQDEQFNIEHWWLSNGMAFDEERNEHYKVTDGPCGCAVGHMIRAGFFPQEILKNSRQAIFASVADILKIYNYKIAEFLFDGYSYIRFRQRPIKKEDVIRRIEFIISEIEAL